MRIKDESRLACPRRIWNHSALVAPGLDAALRARVDRQPLLELRPPSLAPMRADGDG